MLRVDNNLLYINRLAWKSAQNDKLSLLCRPYSNFALNNLFETGVASKIISGIRGYSRVPCEDVFIASGEEIAFSIRVWNFYSARRN